MSRVVCIAGMHRSGTSLIASWLESCGLPMALDRKYGADAGNPRGQFEDADFAELHGTAILAKYPESKGWIVPVDHGVTLGFGYRRKARRLIRDRNQAFEAWGWKDPRTTLFLSTYTRLIPNLTVLAVRRPRDEVVDSLLRRNDTVANTTSWIARDDCGPTYDAYVGELDRFAASHRDRVIETQLSDVLADDRAVFDAVNARLAGALSYRPIGEVYDPSILGR